MPHPEHPVEQPIKALSVFESEGGGEYYEVGRADVTKIEPTTKSGGEYVSIPYIRVWKGDRVHSEHCQHRVMGVYFE